MRNFHVHDHVSNMSLSKILDEVEGRYPFPTLRILIRGPHARVGRPVHAKGDPESGLKSVFRALNLALRLDLESKSLRWRRSLSFSPPSRFRVSATLSLYIFFLLGECNPSFPLPQNKILNCSLRSSKFILKFLTSFLFPVVFFSFFFFWSGGWRPGERVYRPFRDLGGVVDKP